MTERGLLRRVAAILFHRRAGFSANGMGVWQVPDERILEIGPRMAAFRGISHCYQRPTYADWKYQIFTMAHGRSKEECDAILDAIAARVPGDRRTAPRSTRAPSSRRSGCSTSPATSAPGSASTRASEPAASPLSVSLRDTRSEELYARARQYLPGGVNSPVRAMRAIGRDPLFVERGEGAEITDVDGNTYVDYVCSWGALILGHANPAVIEAVDAAAARGTTFGAPTPGEVDLAEEISRRVPGHRDAAHDELGHRGGDERGAARAGGDRAARSCSSSRAPTTATSTGCWRRPGAGSRRRRSPRAPASRRARPRARSSSPGTTPTRVIAATAEHEFAAILVEPYPANMGLVRPQEGFLELLRDRATRTGALLVFDEVITGLRVAPRRRAGADRRDPRPDAARQGLRRRASRPPPTAARAS